MTAIFTKIGIIWCLGPFLGDVKILEYILVLLSKQTQKFWLTHKKALHENDRVSYPNRVKIMQLLRKYKIDYEPQLSDGKYIMKIDYRFNDTK